MYGERREGDVRPPSVLLPLEHWSLQHAVSRHQRQHSTQSLRITISTPRECAPSFPAGLASSTCHHAQRSARSGTLRQTESDSSTRATRWLAPAPLFHPLTIVGYRVGCVRQNGSDRFGLQAGKVPVRFVVAAQWIVRSILKMSQRQRPTATTIVVEFSPITPCPGTVKWIAREPSGASF